MRGPDANNGAGDLRDDVERRHRHGSSPRSAKAMLTAGLKCAPEIGPNIRISTVRMAPVGSVLQSSASAPFPPASLAAMMPEPTTAASKNAVPSNSADEALRQ